MAGETAAHEVVEGHLVEHVSHRRPHCHPQLLQVLGGALVTGLLGPAAADLGQRTVDGSQLRLPDGKTFCPSRWRSSC